MTDFSRCGQSPRFLVLGSCRHELLLDLAAVAGPSRSAEELLRDSTMHIVEIALTVGFQTQAHLTTVFKHLVGCTHAAGGRSTGTSGSDDSNWLDQQHEWRP